MGNASIQYDTAKYPNFREYLWYKAHEEELLEKSPGRYIVIKNEQVMGDFESRKAARLEALKLHKPGTFIIHHCVEEKASLAPRLYGRQLVTIDKK